MPSIGELWSFNFAGSMIIGRMMSTKKLHDGTTVHLFEGLDDKIIYPITKKELCGILVP